MSELKLKRLELDKKARKRIDIEDEKAEKKYENLNKLYKETIKKDRERLEARRKKAEEEARRKKAEEENKKRIAIENEKAEKRQLKLNKFYKTVNKEDEARREEARREEARREEARREEARREEARREELARRREAEAARQQGALRKAAWMSDMKTLKKLIDSGVEANEHTTKYIALHCSAGAFRLVVNDKNIKYITQEVNEDGDRTVSVLEKLSSNRNHKDAEEKIKILITEKGLDPNTRLGQGQKTLLRLAKSSGFEKKYYSKSTKFFIPNEKLVNTLEGLGCKDEQGIYGQRPPAFDNSREEYLYISNALDGFKNDLNETFTSEEEEISF